ncbi:MAG: hypothetical protein ACPGUV_08250 [Polyangiales bacterium]
MLWPERLRRGGFVQRVVARELGAGNVVPGWVQTWLEGKQGEAFFSSDLQHVRTDLRHEPNQEKALYASEKSQKVNAGHVTFVH